MIKKVSSHSVAQICKSLVNILTMLARVFTTDGRHGISTANYVKQICRTDTLIIWLSNNEVKEVNA